MSSLARHGETLTVFIMSPLKNEILRKVFYASINDGVYKHQFQN